MPLINQPKLNTDNISASPYFDWANLMEVRVRIDLENSRHPSIRSSTPEYPGITVEIGEHAAFASSFPQKIYSPTPGSTISTQYYGCGFIKVDSSVHPKGTLAVVKQSVQAVKYTDGNLDDSIWISTIGLIMVEGSGSFGIGLKNKGYWESSTPCTTHSELWTEPGADGVDTGDYYVGISLTTEGISQTPNSAELEYAATIAPYITS